MVKDEDELDLIRGAVKLGATLFERALEVLRPGIKESSWRRNGVRGAAGGGRGDVVFYHYCFGSGSALPHGRASEQAITAGRIRGLRFRCYTRMVIVRIRPALCGWARRRRDARQCIRGGSGERSRRRLRLCGPA